MRHKLRRHVDADYIDLKKLGALLKTRIATFGDIEESIEFVTKRMAMDSELYNNKKNKTTPEICKDILKECSFWRQHEQLRHQIFHDFSS